MQSDAGDRLQECRLLSKNKIKVLFKQMHNCQSRQKRMMNIIEKSIMVLRFNGLFIILWHYTPIMAYAEKIIYGIRKLFKKSENTGKISQYAGDKRNVAQSSFCMIFSLRWKVVIHRHEHQ